jgi:hypothetical protein
LLRGRTNMQSFELFFWAPGPWRGHVREYVRIDCELLCRYLDLRIRELRTCHHMLSRVPAQIRPLYMLATRLFPDWRDSWLMVAQKPTEWKAPSLTEEEAQRILGPFGWDVEVG